jgi:hypothetical protein
MKVAQQPSGRTYLGMLTLPFRDFSFVLKIQCEERGMTGIRDAVLLDRLMRSGEVDLDATGALTGWADDPYDPQNRAAMVRNRAERLEYDAMFPDHPLSRARVMLEGFERSLRVSSNVRDQPPFVFPPK